MDKIIRKHTPDESIITIKINTKFDSKKIEEEDYSQKELTKSFHNAIRNYIENCLIKNEDLEYEIFDIIKNEYCDFSKSFTEFSDLGGASIRIEETQSCKTTYDKNNT